VPVGVTSVDAQFEPKEKERFAALNLAGKSRLGEGRC
jgi:hypothetical protein